MGRAFPARSGCPVPSMSAIAGYLVSSCKVDPPPEPIFQFPIFDKPLANPPSFDFGCYAPSLVTHAFLNQVTPFVNGTVTFPKTTETGQCEPLFTFNVGFPAANCPDVSTSASITLLPPTASPSVKLKVTKSSDCSFAFNLSIGIPGGTCVEVSETDVDGGDFTLTDGDNFTVPIDIVLTSGMHGGCTAYLLTVTYMTFTLDIGPGPITTTGHHMTPDPGCCTSFDVVRSVNGGAAGLLDWYWSTITIPTVGLRAGDEITDATISCDIATEVVANLAIEDASTCPPCGKTIIANMVNLTLKLPAPAAAVVTDSTGTPVACCETIDYIDGTGATPIVLSSDSCAYHLAYTRKAFVLPRTSVVPCTPVGTVYLKDGPKEYIAAIDGTDSCGGCGQTITPNCQYIDTGGGSGTPSFICTISCVGSSLVYTTGSLVFVNGIFMSATTCA